MNRRDFFKKGTTGVVAAGLAPVTAGGIFDNKTEIGERDKDKWHQVATGKMGKPDRKETLKYDVVVIGAGMAGISAAVSAARNGANTLLIQDRPVLGGNASSEMRVTVNGVQSLKNKHIVERETGVIEEILIENWHYNPQESYPIWDHVLYDFVTRQDKLELMLNTQALEAIMNGNEIQAARCWQSTTETMFTIKGKVFIDCSGDGLLAATAGAEYRTGREGKDEFNESFAPDKPDGWTMGDTLMMITKDMGKPTPYHPPTYAIKYNAESAHDRKFRQFKEGFWWVELGSDFDIIAERETNRHKLMGYMHGVWDYLKNSGKYPETANLVLDWVGSIPGRRESRRFMGDHILSQKDLEEYRHFPDAVAYGGWSLDEHCPGGIENLEDRPSFFHARFKKLYEIPFRSLYSKNIENLMFAGRNVSVTHMALSSTRIISTCAMMGQAVGTASAICLRKKINPRKLAEKHINLLQEQILRDDVFIPNRPAKDPDNLANKAKTIFGSSTVSGDAKFLLDGISRDETDKAHHWEADGVHAELQIEWEKAVKIATIELKGDTNLQRKIMMHKNPAKNKGQVLGVPPELIKKLSIEARIDGMWKEVATIDNNITRKISAHFEEIKTTAIRIKLQETHGHKNAKLFEVRCYEA